MYNTEKAALEEMSALNQRAITIWAKGTTEPVTRQVDIFRQEAFEIIAPGSLLHVYSRAIYAQDSQQGAYSEIPLNRATNEVMGTFEGLGVATIDFKIAGIPAARTAIGYHLNGRDESERYFLPSESLDGFSNIDWVLRHSDLKANIDLQTPDGEFDIFKTGELFARSSESNRDMLAAAHYLLWRVGYPADHFSMVGSSSILLAYDSGPDTIFYTTTGPTMSAVSYYDQFSACYIEGEGRFLSIMHEQSGLQKHTAINANTAIA